MAVFFEARLNFISNANANVRDDVGDPVEVAPRDFRFGVGSTIRDQLTQHLFR